MILFLTAYEKVKWQSSFIGGRKQAGLIWLGLLCAPFGEDSRFDQRPRRLPIDTDMDPAIYKMFNTTYQKYKEAN
jgi:hypothetical protein